MQREIQRQTSIQDGHGELLRNMHFEMFVTTNTKKMQKQRLAFLFAFWPKLDLENTFLPYIPLGIYQCMPLERNLHFLSTVTNSFHFQLSELSCKSQPISTCHTVGTLWGKARHCEERLDTVGKSWTLWRHFFAQSRFPFTPTPLSQAPFTQF